MYLVLRNLRKATSNFCVVLFLLIPIFLCWNKWILCDGKADQNNFTEYWSLTSYQLQEGIVLLYCMLLSNVMWEAAPQSLTAPLSIQLLVKYYLSYIKIAESHRKMASTFKPGQRGEKRHCYSSGKKVSLDDLSLSECTQPKLNMEKSSL